ncbi:hypothetical protein BS47DRAFT_68586 [Hydnum rufescens UP504]|uniref:Homeobox domain-containing protein n=1 Tax=Hydnum rufescens UP504 TaxID=1448309 RepID=A0A9P6DTC8_9AGAM|nr:hypothetical protein BS47DRAFT_68586 [Hydnum rufescens UP504]
MSDPQTERRVNDSDKDLESPTSAGPSKPLRVRSFPTPEQRRQLEAEWAKNQNPALAERERIANLTGRSLDQVNGWFNSQRQKARKKARGVSQGHQYRSGDDAEELIIFDAIAPALPKLRQLFEVDSNPSQSKVDRWAAALGNVDAESIHKWLAWKHQDIALKSDCCSEFTPTPKSSVPPLSPYLPTPFSESPEPRRGSTLSIQMKIEGSPAIRSGSLDGTVYPRMLIADASEEYSGENTDEVRSPISPCAEPPSNDAKMDQTRLHGRPTTSHAGPPPPEPVLQLPPGLPLTSGEPPNAAYTPQSTPLRTETPARLQNALDLASLRKFAHDRYPDGIPTAPSIDHDQPTTEYYEAFDFIGQYSRTVTQGLFHARKT